MLPGNERRKPLGQHVPLDVSVIASVDCPVRRQSRRQTSNLRALLSKNHIVTFKPLESSTFKTSARWRKRNIETDGVDKGTNKSCSKKGRSGITVKFDMMQIVIVMLLEKSFSKLNVAKMTDI